MDEEKDLSTLKSEIEEKMTARITAYERGAFDYQEPRHQDWRETYMLYRDKVQVNRLTQRQSVNIPIMKETISTIMANADDAPDIEFFGKNSADDATSGWLVTTDSGAVDTGATMRSYTPDYSEKETALNAYWKATAIQDCFDLKDIVDKKNALLFGRTFKKLNIKNWYVCIEIVDPAHIKVDRYIDPTNINTANYLCHDNIFRTFSELKQREQYDQEVVDELYNNYKFSQWLAAQADNSLPTNVADTQHRQEDLGDMTAMDPLLGEWFTELKEHFVKEFNPSIKDLYPQYAKEFDEDGYLMFIQVRCENNKILMTKPLLDVMNVNFHILTSWGPDIEMQSFWTDGTGDIVRTPNKVLNSWYSQLVENRTLRNFGMNFYDSTIDWFQPQTFDPQPFGWYPIPGEPEKIIKRVEVAALTDSLTEMNFVTDLIKRASAVTSTIQGETAGSRTTLGEIDLVTKYAMERITSMAKFYRKAWEETAYKWLKLVTANAEFLKPIDAQKTGTNGKIYTKTISPTDFAHELGYDIKVTTSAEQEKNNMGLINKFQAVKQFMPSNAAFDVAMKTKLLSILDLTKEQEREIIDIEKKNPTINPAHTWTAPTFGQQTNGLPPWM